MLCVKAIHFCTLAALALGSIDIKIKSTTNCSALMATVIQLLQSLQPSVYPVALAVPPKRHSTCADSILTAVAQQHSWPLLIFEKPVAEGWADIPNPLDVVVQMTIVVGDPDQILDSIEHLRSGYLWNADGIVVVILESDNQIDIDRTVGYLEQAFVRRFSVLTPVSNGTVSVWSGSDPIASVCGYPNGAASLLGLWNTSVEGSRQRFLTNLQPSTLLSNVRCPFRVYIWDDEPFALNEGKPRGSAVELYKFLTQQTNFHLQFVSLNASASFSSHGGELELGVFRFVNVDPLHVNGLRFLNTDPIDSIGGCILPTTLRYRVLSLVHSYCFSSMHIYVREVPNKKLPLPGGSTFVWPVFLIMWIFVFWLLKLVRHGTDRRISRLTFWGVMMEVTFPAYLMPLSTKKRVFLSLFLICTFVTNLDVRSDLVSARTAYKVQPEFSNLGEVMSSDAMVGYTSNLSYALLNELVPGTDSEKLLFRTQRSVNCEGRLWAQCMKRFATAIGGRSLVLLASDERVRFWSRFRQRPYYSLNHPVISSMCCVYMRKGNPWSNHFRRLISLANAAGLDIAWAKKANRRADKRWQDKRDHYIHGLSDVVLGFQALAVGLVGAILVFCIELGFFHEGHRFSL